MNDILMVYKNGIINQYQISNGDDNSKTLCQVVWNGMLQGTIHGMNREPTEHHATKNTWYIKDYRAIYLNGVMIVKDGEVYPKKKKRFWLF